MMNGCSEKSYEKEFLKKAGSKIAVYVAGNENSAVMRAVENFAQDWLCAADMTVEYTDREKEADIIVGTLQNEHLFPRGMGQELRDENHGPRWEGYCIHAEMGKLYILGADRRGAVYGIYEVSGQLGVSPWHYWGDVPCRKKSEVHFPEGYHKTDWPTIPYRGIFINDEEELEAWVRARGEEPTLGPVTYEKIYELILRLGGNSLWPAMHVNAFNKNSLNGRLADEMGIVIGTSHCDILLRNNNHEWEDWIRDKGYSGAVYDYSVPGENRRILQEYWRESAEQNRDYEVSYTLGMRGIHDSPFQTECIDAMPLTEEEKKEKKKELLEKAIRDQRAILDEVLGKDCHPLQIFIPYKEVLPLYDSGLEVPEDVTLIWVDDNFGYMRRYPEGKELLRRGGHGLYYHASYWGCPNMSYLLLNSIPLSHTKHELQKAYESGIRKLWIYNVGAIKPLEQDMEFFLRYAWEVGKETSTADVKKYLELWINRNFSGDYGAEAADILITWSQLTNMRKPEHMGRNVFSQTAYGDEAGRRIHQYQELFLRVNEIWRNLPEEERAAFFELVAFKVHISFYIYASFYYSDRSELCIRQGKYRAANRYVREVMRMEQQKEKLIDYYNHRLMGGKWCDILTPEAYPPPSVPGDMACMPVLWKGGKIDRRWSALKCADADADRLGVVLWGEELPFERDEIVFTKWDLEVKWLEVFTKDMENVSFRIEHSSWVQVTEERGVVETEKRIGIRVLKTGECREDGFLRIYESEQKLIRSVRIRTECEAERKSCLRINADGYLSVLAENFTGKKGEGWRRIAYLGRGSGAVMENVRGGVLEYECYFGQSCECQMDIYRFPSLNSVGRIRLGVQMDEGEVHTLESLSGDEWRHNWKRQVMENVELLSVKLGAVRPGRHVLKIIGIDAYFGFSGFVLYTGEKKRTYAAPPALTGKRDKADWRIPIPDWRALDDTARSCYGLSGGEEMPADRKLCCLTFQRPERDIVKSGSIHDLIPSDSIDAGKKLSLWQTIVNGEGTWKGIDISGFGREIFAAKSGMIRISAAEALGDTQNAFCTCADGAGRWSYGLTGKRDCVGLYLYPDEAAKPKEAGEKTSSLNYRIRVEETGKYSVWLRLRIKDGGEKVLNAALDGRIQPCCEQTGGGRLWTFEGLQIFQWIELSALWIERGEHIFSVVTEEVNFSISEIVLSNL